MKNLDSFDPQGHLLGKYNKPYKTKEKINFQIGDGVLFVNNESSIKVQRDKLYAQADPLMAKRLNKVNKLKDFLRNNVGKIINKKIGPFVNCAVEYSNVPEELVNLDYLNDYGLYYCDDNIFVFHQSEIRRATPEEIENQKVKDNIKKYNL